MKKQSKTSSGIDKGHVLLLTDLAGRFWTVSSPSGKGKHISGEKHISAGEQTLTQQRMLVLLYQLFLGIAYRGIVTGGENNASSCFVCAIEDMLPLCCSSVVLCHIKPSGTPNSTVNTRLIGNQSINRGCHLFIYFSDSDYAIITSEW